jgi:hypothetical protein
MWSRVSWRRQSATSESILSPETIPVSGGKVVKKQFNCLLWPLLDGRKGSRCRFRHPVAGAARKRPSPEDLRGDPKRLGDVAAAAGKSCLFCLSLELPERPSPRARDDVAKSAPHGRWRRGVRRAAAAREKPSEGDEERRAGPYRISAAGLRGAQPLVDGAM